MDLTFRPLHLDDVTGYRQRLAATPQVASDYSFVNLYGWGGEYGLEVACTPELVWIRQAVPRSCLWAPVGDWTAVDWKTVLQRLPRGTEFTRVPEQLVDLWRAAHPQGLEVREERGNWDYLYSVEDLATLKGNRFHKKKNLLNQFVKNTPFRYEAFNAELIDQALALQDDWCSWRDCEAEQVLAAENTAIQRTFGAWRELTGLTGGAILVEGIIVAYTIAEPLTDDTLVIHFEKGCPAHKGVYQAINQMFLASVPERYTLVNREQDLGDEGLRKAKLSYNPVGFLKKYGVTLM
jgi:hypothetical protein